MFNVFVFRKWAALLLCSTFAALGMVCGLFIQNSFWWGLTWMACGSLIAVLVSNFWLLKNPFNSMLEGDGILTINMDSTGIMQPFIVSIVQEATGVSLWGMLGKQKIRDPFNREMINYMTLPTDVPNGAHFVKSGEKEVIKQKEKVVEAAEGDLIIHIKKSELHLNRFGMFHFPTIFYNQKLGTTVSKEFLGTNENAILREHLMVYLLHSVREHSDRMFNFARGVIDSLSAKFGGGSSTWLWVIIGVIVVGGLAVFLGPNILAAFKGAMPSAQSAVQAGSTATGPVVPQ